MCRISPEIRRASTILNAQLSLIAGRSEGEIRDLMMGALDAPDPKSIRAALNAVRNGPWEAALIAAIAEVGIACAAALGEVA